MREIKFRAWNSIDKCFCDNSTTLTNLRGFIKSKHYHPMQFTGLKDKNGVEIYEGDILSHSKQGFCAVKYGNKHFDYAGFTLENQSGMTNTLQNPYIYEVIGNIHENPELLT